MGWTKRNKCHSWKSQYHLTFVAAEVGLCLKQTLCFSWWLSSLELTGSNWHKRGQPLFWQVAGNLPRIISHDSDTTAYGTPRNDTPWTPNHSEQDHDQPCPYASASAALLFSLPTSTSQAFACPAMSLKIQEMHVGRRLRLCPASFGLERLVIELYSSSQRSKQTNPVTAFLARKDPPQSIGHLHCNSRL